MYQQLRFKQEENFSLTKQEILVSLIVALICLLSEIFFPAKNFFQEATKSLFFLVALPIIYIKLVLGKELADFGWNTKNQLPAFFWGTILTTITFLILYLLIHFTSFKTNYVLEEYLKTKFWFFLFYELFIINLIAFVFNFFFHGFFLAILRKIFKHWAITIQAVLFFAFSLIFNSTPWQMTPFFLLSITAGILAYKTKSFFYSYFMSLFVIIILDAYIIYLTK